MSKTECLMIAAIAFFLGMFAGTWVSFETRVRVVTESIPPAIPPERPCISYRMAADVYGEDAAFGMIEPEDMLRCYYEN